MSSSLFYVHGNCYNQGTAVAYNSSVRYALSQGFFSHVILLDQDSCPSDSYLDNFRSCSLNFFEDAIFCAFDHKNFPEKRGSFSVDDFQFRLIRHTKASGMIIPLSVLNGDDFNAKLFVDYVDWAFCWSMHRKGISIIECSQLRLSEYSLGEKLKFLCFLLSIPSMSRRRIQARSALYFLRHRSTFKFAPFSTSIRILLRLIINPLLDIFEFIGLIKIRQNAN